MSFYYLTFTYDFKAAFFLKSWAVEDDFYGILQTVGSTVTRQIVLFCTSFNISILLQQSGYSRGQFSHGELAEELTNERVAVEYELCKVCICVILNK